MMNNDITINPTEINSHPDKSITDNETIRQIALYTNKTGDNSLVCKIKKEYSFAGLYPEVIRSFHILPD